VNRSWHHNVFKAARQPNAALWWVIAAALAFLLLVLNAPTLHEVFHFAPITALQFFYCVLAGVLSVLWFEIYKAFNK